MGVLDHPNYLKLKANLAKMIKAFLIFKIHMKKIKS